MSPGTTIMVVIAIGGLALSILPAYAIYKQAFPDRTLVSGIFGGLAQSSTWLGSTYYVKVGTQTLSCGPISSVSAADIVALSNLKIGENVTMTKACANVEIFP